MTIVEQEGSMGLTRAWDVYNEIVTQMERVLNKVRAVIDNIEKEEKWSELQFIDTGLFQRFPFSSVVKSQLITKRTYLHILSYSGLKVTKT